MRLIGTLTLCLLLAGSGIANAQKTPTAPYTAAAIIEQTNDVREKIDVEPLHTNTQLMRAAQKKANDMVARGYFSHTGPKNEQFWKFITNEGYAYTYAGENLAVHYMTTETLIQAWVASPGHYGNMVNPDFTDIGIGIARGERKGAPGWYVVQMFGTKE